MDYKPPRRATCVPLRCAIAALALHASVATGADTRSRQDLLVFLSSSIGQQFGISSQERLLDREDFLPTADFLYTYNDDRLRLLGEYFWTSEEHELERLQLGWKLGDETVLWLGRFHQPATVWNTEYHHGQYLQTSIDRPGFEQWEDDGGILLQHSTGLLIESAHDLSDQSALQYELSVGTGEVFDGADLRPFDLLDPQGGYDLAYAFRLTYLPHTLGDNEVGVIGDRSTIPIDDAGASGLHEVVQTKLGVYADWSWGRWRTLPTLYHVQTRLDGPGDDRTQSFQAAYLQAEYGFHLQWTAFARAEEVTDTDSVYLQLFPELVSSRRVLGLRWDAAPRHAVTLQLMETEQPTADFGELRVQWSAVFP